MKSFSGTWEKISVLLRIRPVANGLEITDELARISYFDGNQWQFRAVRFEPGILDQGKIKNRESLIASLSSLRSQMPGFAGKTKKMNVIVTVGATSVYNQVFHLPLVRGENLASAVELNLRMATPADFSKVYSGWQTIERDEAESKIAILGVFIDKAIIDEMTDALFAAGFVAVVFESKALALTRALRMGGGIASDKSYVAVIIDDVGSNFLIIRNGKLCFDYRNIWRDIADDKGSISLEKFKESFATSMRQVMNFYSGHWPEPLAGIVFSAVALQDEARRLINGVTPIPVFLPTLDFGQDIPAEWLVVLGSGLRGLHVKESEEISLLGAGAQETFENNRILHFLSFWSLVTPVVFAILAIVFVVADGFVTTTQKTVASTYQAILASGQRDSQAMVSLKSEATDFNRSVALIASVQNTETPSSLIVQGIVAAASANNVVISHISFTSPTDPIAVSGTSDSESSILAFKSAIENTPIFGPATLPLSEVENVGNSYTFSMTFSLKK